MEEVDGLLSQLRAASPAQREPVKQALIVLAGGSNGARVREHLESRKRGELLEVQWEIEEVIDATAPKAAAPPPPAVVEAPVPEVPDPNKPLTSKDLTLIYDDPRGLVLHKTKAGPERWFATQFDQRSGQPQTFELVAAEVAQLKQQLAGSPHWVIGGGGLAAPGAAAASAPAPARPPGR
ncbi:MAG: hypothetical protein EXR69_11265 [Myxococcales bacterium]|nr:hypothetical protein [Myxococcales bacterium]